MRAALFAATPKVSIERGSECIMGTGVRWLSYRWLLWCLSCWEVEVAGDRQGVPGSVCYEQVGSQWRPGGLSYG